MWCEFLMHPSAYYRSFMDMKNFILASEQDFYSDASKNPKLGFGAKCDRDWLFHAWDENWIKINNPSIGYLELYALTAAVLTWLHKFSNKRIIILCDNQSVVHMINNTSSTCKNCMVLIRIIVLHSLIHNVRVYAKYVKSKDNEVSDSLSRLDWVRFNKLKAKKNLNIAQ